MSKKTDIIDFVVNANTHGDKDLDTASQAERLMSVARSISRLNTLDCNYGLTDRQQKRSEKLEAEAVRLGISLGAEKVLVSGDPRGMAVKLQGGGWPNNSFGGDGYCVPEG